MTAAGTHHGLVQPPAFVVKNYGSAGASADCMVKRPSEPLGAVTSRDHHAVVEMPHHPFLTNYSGHGGVTGVDEPASTVTTKDRHALVEPGTTPAIEHCTFRMLEPPEIGRAMTVGSPSAVAQTLSAAHTSGCRAQALLPEGSPASRGVPRGRSSGQVHDVVVKVLVVAGVVAHESAMPSASRRA
jgi:hypothetical protein